MEAAIQTVIDNRVSQIVSQMIEEYAVDVRLQEQLEDPARSLFRKTEGILYSYPIMKETLLEQEAAKQEIRKHGIFRGSLQPSEILVSSSHSVPKSEYERQDEQLQRLDSSISELKNRIATVDRGLKVIAEDPFFNVIRLKYFEGQYPAKIARHLGISPEAVKEEKNRLVTILLERIYREELQEHLDRLISWLMS